MDFGEAPEVEKMIIYIGEDEDDDDDDEDEYDGDSESEDWIT